MKEKEQSSIEWLISEIEQRNGIIESETDPLTRGSMISYGYGDLYEQAKELHKKEIIEAATYGNIQEFYDGTETIGEKYYTEKYN